MPRSASELPVGGGPEPDILLQGNDLADRGVFNLSQAVSVEAAFGVGRAGPDELGRAKEAADVVRTKWWRSTGRHAPVHHEVDGQVNLMAASPALRLNASEPSR